MLCAAPFDRRTLILLNFLVSFLKVSQSTSLMLSRGSKDTETKGAQGMNPGLTTIQTGETLAA